MTIPKEKTKAKTATSPAPMKNMARLVSSVVKEVRSVRLKVSLREELTT